jgi:NADH-quinone oxidoreductase subunit A
MKSDTFFIAYNNAVLFFFSALIIAALFIVLPIFLSKGSTRFEKFRPYECGVESFGAAKQFVEIQFFIIAVLFLIFDLELMLVIP